MYKIVKGKIRKYYCDICGKNICDYKPHGESSTWMNANFLQLILKKEYCDYKLGVGFTDYCMDCYKKEEKNL